MVIRLWRSMREVLSVGTRRNFLEERDVPEVSGKEAAEGEAEIMAGVFTSKEVEMLKAEVSRLQAVVVCMEKEYISAVDQSTRYWQERDGWMESAAQFSRNSDFYRGLVYEIGDFFGDAAKTADDGKVMEEVLALKVPELVLAMRAEISARDRCLAAKNAALIKGHAVLSEHAYTGYAVVATALRVMWDSYGKTWRDFVESK